ncbi:hypothetical protein A9Q83_06130 [Alphaproteobacteria bacterium 46_93_T64]|nr:hypothetical protein A9Q83_06130 [Alphaproteobacteria bacterium 46_93_T64]
MNEPYELCGAGVKLLVRLSPGSSANRMDGLYHQADGACRLRVKVTAVPEKGKANKALTKVLSKKLKIPARDMELISGQTDRNKTILITGNADQVMSELKLRFAEFS